MVIHFTDGADGDLADLHRASEALREEGRYPGSQAHGAGLGEAGLAALQRPLCGSPRWGQLLLEDTILSSLGFYACLGLWDAGDFSL